MWGLEGGKSEGGTRGDIPLGRHAGARGGGKGLYIFERSSEEGGPGNEADGVRNEQLHSLKAVETNI